MPLAPADREAMENAARDGKAITREPGWLQAFVRRAWSIVEPRPLVWNWHLTLLCVELERVAAGLTRELVISVPPGTAKSLIVSALFPAALWLRQPELQLLTIAHNKVPVTRDSKRHRDIVLSAWYRGLVERLAREEGIGLVPDRNGDPRPWTLAADQNEKLNFQNTAHGGRQVGTVGGGITGARCGGLLVDDPYDAEHAAQGSPAQVAERMAEVVSAYDSNWKNRVHPIDGWRITIMQGVAEGDLSDVLVRRGVRRVVLPMEYDPDVKVWVTRRGAAPVEERLYHPRDPRKNLGDPLFPALFSREYLDDFKWKGGHIWGPQYQQVRASLGGKLFPRSLFGIPHIPNQGVQRYTAPPERMAKGVHHIGISVDCTFANTKGSDKVALHVWAWMTDSPHRFLLDRVCDQMDIAGTIAAIAHLHAKWSAIAPGRVRFVLLETKANGPAVITLFTGRLKNVIGYNPQASKFARAQITSYAMHAGNVWYPMPEHAPWVGELVEFHVGFTGAEGGRDDDIDAESQIMIQLDDADAIQPNAALDRIRAIGLPARH